MQVTAGYYLMKNGRKAWIHTVKDNGQGIGSYKEGLLRPCAGSIGYGKLTVKQNLLNRACLIWSKSWYNQDLTSGELNEILYKYGSLYV